MDPFIAQETRKNSINKIFPICAIAIIIFFVGYSLSSLKTSRETLANAKNEKWLQQYYQDIEEKATYPDEWDLSIVDSEKEYSGGSYGHITGTVRNITEDKTISSFKVVVKLAQIMISFTELLGREKKQILILCMKNHREQSVIILYRLKR